MRNETIIEGEVINEEVVDTTPVTEEKAELLVNDFKPEIQPGTISWNFEEIMGMAEIIADKFRNQEITDENFKEVKSTDKLLGTYIKNLKEAKKKVDKILTDPVKKFDGEVKEVIAVLEAGQADIKAKYAPYDEARVREKTEKIISYKDKQVAMSGLRDEYTARIKVDFVTLSSKVKDDKAKVDSQIELLVNEQTTNDALVVAINSAVDAGNITVSQKMSDNDKKRFFNDAMKDFSENSLSCDETVQHIVDIINSEFENLRIQENKIREDAVMAERARVEETNSSNNISEIPVAEIPVVNTSVPEDADVRGPVMAESAPVIPVALEMPGEFVDPKEEKTVSMGDNRPFRYQIALEGPFDSIKASGSEFKAVCKKYGIKFVPLRGDYLDAEITA